MFISTVYMFVKLFNMKIILTIDFISYMPESFMNYLKLKTAIYFLLCFVWNFSIQDSCLSQILLPVHIKIWFSYLYFVCIFQAFIVSNSFNTVLSSYQLYLL